MISSTVYFSICLSKWQNSRFLKNRNRWFRWRSSLPEDRRACSKPWSSFYRAPIPPRFTLEADSFSASKNSSFSLFFRESKLSMIFGRAHENHERRIVSGNRRYSSYTLKWAIILVNMKILRAKTIILVCDHFSVWKTFKGLAKCTWIRANLLLFLLWTWCYFSNRARNDHFSVWSF